jgi:hypothetical protein
MMFSPVYAVMDRLAIADELDQEIHGKVEKV